MTIHIESLTFDTIIGMLDFERERPQKVIIDLSAEYEYRQNNFIDYTDIVTLIKDELYTKRYELLEDALLGLKELLFKTFPQITILTLKIAKPNIFPDCTVALSNTWERKIFQTA